MESEGPVEFRWRESPQEYPLGDLDTLIERLNEAGLDEQDARLWASTDIDEDLPSLATYVFLRSLWKILTSAQESLLSAANTASLSEKEINSALGVVAWDFVRLLEGQLPMSEKLRDRDPGWRIVEAIDMFELTDRDLGGFLSSNLWATYPEGENVAADRGWIY